MVTVITAFSKKKLFGKCEETLDTDLGSNELTVNNEALVFETLGDSMLVEVSYKGACVLIP